LLYLKELLYERLTSLNDNRKTIDLLN